MTSNSTTLRYIALGLFLSFIFTVNAKAADDPVLPQGTPIKVRLTEDVSPDKVKLGDAVDLEVAEDVSLNNHVVIPKGTKVQGFITDVQPKFLWGKTGKVVVDIAWVTFPSGVIVTVDGAISNQYWLKDPKPEDAFLAKGTLATATVQADTVIPNPGSR